MMMIRNLILAFFLLTTVNLQAQAVILQTGDQLGNEYTQAETSSATPFAVKTVIPEEKEAGRMTINYNGVNPLTGAAADRVIMVRYKKVSGVVSIIGSQTVYTNNDAGMNSVTVTVTASGGLYSINVVGLAGTSIRHTLIVTTLSSKQQEP